jgi:hypothetical protein
LLGVNGNLCGIAVLQAALGNGKLPPDTFRLVVSNINNHLTTSFGT